MKEQQLQKRLNEICGTIENKKSTWLIYEDKKVFQENIEVLLPISLELILAALNNVIIYSIEPCENGVEITGNNFFDWIFFTPFSLQPTETQEALYKIFEIE